MSQVPPDTAVLTLTNRAPALYTVVAAPAASVMSWKVEVLVIFPNVVAAPMALLVFPSLLVRTLTLPVAILLLAFATTIRRTM
jgi:hypothetical protein